MRPLRHPTGVPNEPPFLRGLVTLARARRLGSPPEGPGASPLRDSAGIRPDFAAHVPLRSQAMPGRSSSTVPWASEPRAGALARARAHHRGDRECPLFQRPRLDEDVPGRVMALSVMGFGDTGGLANLLIGPVVGAVRITNVLLFVAGVAPVRTATPRSGRRGPHREVHIRLLGRQHLVEQVPQVSQFHFAERGESLRWD